jgi:protoporphyrinogen oxidase
VSENKKQHSHIAILGGGPAGLALAMQLLHRPGFDAAVTVIEQAEQVGGIAGSFEVEGIHLDYGSHRLHPATDPQIMAAIQELLGDDLLCRPRNGRIRLMNRFVKFPLNPLNLALHLPPSFMAGVVRDSVVKTFRNGHRNETFADALIRGLGPTVCRRFYFPYARKLWGLDPEQIAVEQAQKRVSANNISKILRKALAMIPGLKPPGAGIFYYPRKGFGQITDAMAQQVRDLGGQLSIGTPVHGVSRLDNERFRVEYAGSQQQYIDVDRVFSTLPMRNLALMLQPSVPSSVREAAEQMQSRGMVFLYLVLAQQQFTPYDAHYFPETEILPSRMSEPKNYSATAVPSDKTILCYEIPCTEGDDTWNASAETLCERVKQDMAYAGLSIRTLKDCFLRRHPGVYPVYNRGFADHFSIVDDYLSGLPGLVCLGRQGLFAHDNTHHTLEMGWSAAACMDNNLHWDHTRWAALRKAFEAHVVED